MPTSAECAAEKAVLGGSSAPAQLFAALKLTMAGTRYSASGPILNSEIRGYYWTSTPSGSSNNSIRTFLVGYSDTTLERVRGASVRCIRD